MELVILGNFTNFSDDIIKVLIYFISVILYFSWAKLMFTCTLIRHHLFLQIKTTARALNMRPRRYIVDRMDANLVKCFSPLYQMLMFLGCARISFKDHLVTTPTVWQKLYTLFCIAAVTFSFFYLESYYYTTYYLEDTIIYMASITGILVQYISHFTNTIHTRFWDSESAVNLFLMLQKVDNTLSLKEFQCMKEQQYYWNLIVLVLIIAFFECGFIVHAMFTVEHPILTVFVGLGLLNVYVEIVLCASLIFFLAIRLRFLNKVIDYNFQVKCTAYFKEPIKPIVVNENFIITADSNDSNKLEIEKLLDCFKQILKLYKLITEIFSFPVSNIKLLKYSILKS